MTVVFFALLALLQAGSVVDADKLYAAKRYQEAAKHYRALLQQSPDDPVLQLKLGVSLLSAGAPREALSLLEKAERELAGNPALLQAMAHAYFATGRLGEAAERYRQLVEAAPRDTGFLVRLGVCEYQLGEYAGAEEAFRKALDSSPNHPRALTRTWHVTQCPQSFQPKHYPSSSTLSNSPHRTAPRAKPSATPTPKQGSS